MDQFIVSARKYRPATFDMVVGQQAITSTLKNAIRNNILAQAFLFTGPRGVGKTTCARILAKTINCLNPTADMEACDQCESCVSFRNSASFNIHELDAASNNSVDDIRNLVDQVRIPPQVGKYKIYIIDEVHMLSSQAFNAFLKTLEEPPSYAKFILATTEKHKIIPTILSRCQIFDFKRITVEDIVKQLQYVAEKEGVKAEYDALTIIAQKADGAMRDALSIFDQMLSFSGNEITYRSVIDNLNVLDYEYYFKITDAVLTADSTAVLMMLNEIIDNGFDPQDFITGLGSHFRSLLVSRDAETIQLLETSQNLRDRYAAQAMRCGRNFLLSALELQNQCDLNYVRSSNKRLLVELALLQMCALNEPSHSAPPLNPTQVGLPSGNQANVTNTSRPPAQTMPKSSAPTPTVLAVQNPETGQIQTPPSPVTIKEQNVAPTAQPQTGKELPKPATSPSRQKVGTLSIHDIAVDYHAAEQKPVFRDKPFDQETLIKIWNAYADTRQNVSPSFANAMRRHQPETDGKTKIIFKAESSLIASDKENQAQLLGFLKKELDNNQISIEIQIVDAPVEKIAYTDSEKFEKMAELRPELRLLRDQLELETEL
ncbi:MAG: DNA polymerase III subunit gamma/tau [Bacteroidales bacterium]|nr:DNA polymerase III subunit gamma/tau [Bacteroidales bacterium]